ncbi:MAG TPA: hypothetical protein PL089_12595 [Ignavibacteria bacterium]|nr:hypothetical protein [Ignavibacteria bacterium]
MNWISEYQSEIIVLFIGIGIGLLVYYKWYYKRNTFFCITGFKLSNSFSPDKNKLKMIYENHEVDKLTVSHIAIWNGGRKTIRKSDIDNEDPPRIEFINDCRIYNIEISMQSDTSNNFKIEQAGKSKCLLTFDQIGKSQGCVIKILHSGKEPNEISVLGKMKETGSIKKRIPQNSYYVWPLSIGIIDMVDGIFFNFGTYTFLTFLLTLYGYIVIIILSPVFFSNWKNILPENLYKDFVSED